MRRDNAPLRYTHMRKTGVYRSARGAKELFTVEQTRARVFLRWLMGSRLTDGSVCVCVCACVCVFGRNWFGYMGEV